MNAPRLLARLGARLAWLIPASTVNPPADETE